MRPPNPLAPSRRRALLGAGAFAALLLAPPAIGLPIVLTAVVVRAALAATKRLHGRAAGEISSGRSLRLLPRRLLTQGAGAAGDGQGRGIGLGADLVTGREIVLPEQALAAHGLVLGASGAGKTTTLLRVLTRQIEQGRPVVVIDLKGSPALARALGAAAAAAGRELRVWTLDGGSWWNPLSAGNATELKDKIISTERFSEPHYKRAAERYLQTAIQVLQQTAGGTQVTLSAVVAMLDPQRLAARAAALEADQAAHVRDYVRTLTPDQLSAIRGLASRLAILTESHTGRYLQPAHDTLPELNVRRALEGGEVALFSLNSSTYGQLAAQLGTLAVQDLVTASGARLSQNRNPPQATVAIDEFSALGSDNVIALLARGRESRVGVLLATQELSDLDRAARGLRDQVLGNTAIKVAHRQDVPESAQVVAQLAGTIKRWEHTYTSRAGGFGQRASHGANTRLVEKPIVEPEQVRSLKTGEAVMIIKSPRSSTHLTRVLPPRVERGQREQGR